jgi:hypothetical protein
VGIPCQLYSTYRGNPRTGLVRAAAPCRRCFPSCRCCLVRVALECLKCGLTKMEGAAVAGHRCFVASPLPLFPFFLGMFLLLPQHFLVFEIIYGCSCYINIAGRNLFRGREPLVVGLAAVSGIRQLRLFSGISMFLWLCSLAESQIRFSSISPLYIQLKAFLVIV